MVYIALGIKEVDLIMTHSHTIQSANMSVTGLGLAPHSIHLDLPTLIHLKTIGQIAQRLFRDSIMYQIFLILSTNPDKIERRRGVENI